MIQNQTPENSFHTVASHFDFKRVIQRFWFTNTNCM